MRIRGGGDTSLESRMQSPRNRQIGSHDRYGRIDLRRARTDVEFSVADAEALPFEDESFDAVVMRNVLWNTFDPEKAMEEACRVLKPNGITVITDGSWQANISAWRSADPDSDRFPNHIRRDLGLGAEDVIDIFYDRLPLKNESRPAWDEHVLSSRNMDIVLCDGFDDPMMEDISDVVGTGFILVARKN